MIKILLKITLVLLAVLLLILLIGPFLIPIPPLANTRPPAELADPDSRFIEIEGVQVHYKQAGQGEPVFILLHGFASSVYSWREVIAPLAEIGTVIAFDRPAFGLTERPLTWEGENPYTTAFSAKLTVGLMNALGVEQAILVGNSAGGTVSMLTALEHPDRVQALILVDPAIYTTSSSRPAALNWILHTPQAQRLGLLVVRRFQETGLDFGRSAWHDPSKLTDEIWAGYTLPLQADNWDVALWQFTLAAEPLYLPERLNELTPPTLVITGDDDRIVPTADSIKLAGEIPGAQLVVIAECGHVPHEEKPAEFLQAVGDFIATLR
jgi:pimeloyl-ACP methyl ester carboxylesterase